MSLRTRIASLAHAFGNRLGDVRASIRTSAELLAELLRNYSADASSGEVVTPDSAMRSGTVFACVRVVSEDVGKLPLILYRRTADGGKERATNHPLYRLMRAQPNMWQTPMMFLGMGQAHLELRGHAFAYITRVRGEIRELLPLHPDRVDVEQRPDWSLKYMVRMRQNSEPVEVPASQMLHVVGLTLDGYCGVSTIEYARETIGLAIATERHGSRLFKNAARPSGVIQRPGDKKAMSPEAGKRFIDSFHESYGGENALRVALIEEGMEYKAISMTNEDAQFLETRQYGRSEIAGIFRIPPHKIGDLSRSTFSNIEHQALEYLSDSLLPRLTRWEQSLNRALLTPAEQEEFFFEFLVDGVLRADFQTRMNGYAVAIQNGILSPNEVRVKENLNPREGGDEYLRPGNMLPANAAAPDQKGGGSADPQQNKKNLSLL